MAKITKDTIIGNVLDIAPEAAPMFLSIGMHCLGCPSSRGETVEEACAVHGVDVDKLLAVVNALFGVLTILGIVTDPTTKGVGDSTQALTYDKPKEG